MKKKEKVWKKCKNGKNGKQRKKKGNMKKKGREKKKKKCRSTSPRKRSPYSSNVRKAWRSGTSTILPGWRATRVGPGLHPQYTRAQFAGEAVGGLSSSRAQ